MKRTKARIAYTFFGLLIAATVGMVIWAIDQTSMSFAPGLGTFVGALIGGAIVLAIVILMIKTLVQWIQEDKE